MKLFRNIVILVIILGLLGSAYFVIKNKKGTIATSPDAAQTTLINVSKDKIAELDLNTGESNFGFTQKNSVWTMKQPANIEVDSTKVDDIATGLANLSAIKLVEDNPTDLAKYGLDKPETVTLKLTQGNPIVMYVGNDNDITSSTYVKMGDSNKVYTINNLYGDKLKIKLDDVRKITLFPFQSTDVRSFTMEKNGSVAYKLTSADGKTWQVVSPIEMDGDSSGIPDLLTTITGLSVSGIVEANPADLSKYGLDKPSYAIELSTGSKTARLLLGSENADKISMYAKLADQNDVFTIDDSSLTFLDKSLSDVMDKFVFITDISNISRMEIQMDGQSISADMKVDPNSSANDKFSVNGKDVSQLKDDSGYSFVNKLYEAAVGLTIDDLDIGAKPADTPEVTLTYYQNGRTDKIELVSKNDEYYYVFKDGKYTNALVYKSQLDANGGLRQALKNLNDAMGKMK